MLILLLHSAKIVSPEGKLLGPGEVGELWTRSPSNALGCEWISILHFLVTLNRRESHRPRQPEGNGRDFRQRALRSHWR